MQNKISQEVIQSLLTIETSPKVTLYIPMEATAAPQHISENQIRFKNMIHTAVEQLKQRGDNSKLSNELCDMLDKHYSDMEFWKSHTRAMLLCAAPGEIHTFQLPVDTEEYAVVDDEFHLAPILALIGDAKEYYVLALAQQNLKIYKGDMYELQEVEIGLPSTMRAALGIDEPNQQSENQGSATGSSLNTGWFNGRGGARDPQDNDRLKYFHLVDKYLHDKIDRNIPMILAGIDAEVAEYKQLSKYPRILDGFIPGNHTETRSDELFHKSIAIIRHELIMPEHEAAKDEYARILGVNPDKVARDEASIEQAADQGRIDKLLAQLGRHTTDTIQDKIESAFRISFPEGNKGKMLNKLAMKVWQQSGKVMSLMPHEMPNGALMVARLRY